MRKHINMGSVSHATMRTEDLIPAFLSELESQKPLKRAHRKLTNTLTKTIQKDSFYYESEEAQEDLSSLFDALNEYCLPYFYFGAHPGDGSDYGYWLSESWDEDFCDNCSHGHPNCTQIKVGDTSEILSYLLD